ncbi:MAG: DUF2306 domain-containing protein [Anaerolineales bacterium]|nr:DUF2306 domain-containing protein [Anaerolineales bacterium]
MKAIIQNNGQMKVPARKNQIPWWVPAGLIVLSVIPLTFGVIRLIQLINGAEITPANARFFASPAPVVIHIISAAIYALLGAFQFVSRLWQRGIKWHRWVGRLLVPIGLLVGFSGVWMTLFYPRTDALLFTFRLIFGSGMILSIILGYISILRRNVAQHQAWMTRAYAIGMGAGTQVLTGMVGAMIFGKPNEFENALLMGAAWMINLAIAEWSINKGSTRQLRTA